MYYKVIKDDRVIDAIRDVEIVYLKYQERYDRFVFCDISEAQAIFSSDRNYIWHIDGLYDIPVDGYDTVEIIPIDAYEYRNLKVFDCEDQQQLIDNYTLMLIEDGVI